MAGSILSASDGAPIPSDWVMADISPQSSPSSPRGDAELSSSTSPGVTNPPAHVPIGDESRNTAFPPPPLPRSTLPASRSMLWGHAIAGIGMAYVAAMASMFLFFPPVMALSWIVIALTVTVFVLTALMMFVFVPLFVCWSIGAVCNLFMPNAGGGARPNS